MLKLKVLTERILRVYNKTFAKSGNINLNIESK